MVGICVCAASCVTCHHQKHHLKIAAWSVHMQISWATSGSTYLAVCWRKWQWCISIQAKRMKCIRRYQCYGNCMHSNNTLTPRLGPGDTLPAGLSVIGRYEMWFHRTFTARCLVRTLHFPVGQVAYQCAHVIYKATRQNGHTYTHTPCQHAQVEQHWGDRTNTAVLGQIFINQHGELLIKHKVYENMWVL